MKYDGPKNLVSVISPESLFYVAQFNIGQAFYREGYRGRLKEARGALSLIQPDHNPGLLGNKSTSKLHVVTCKSCGYTEFYAYEPDRFLLETH